MVVIPAFPASALCTFAADSAPDFTAHRTPGGLVATSCQRAAARQAGKVVWNEVDGEKRRAVVQHRRADILANAGEVGRVSGLKGLKNGLRMLICVRSRVSQAY
jgi:hypothetical protein